MIEHLKLEHVGPGSNVELEFAPRLNLLTGDNGLGKTFVLDVVWWALTRTWAEQPAWPQRSPNGHDPRIEYRVRGKVKATEQSATYDFSLQDWVLAPGRPPMPGLVIYARVDGSFSVWDPARNYWRNAPSLDIRQFDRPAAYLFSPGALWNGLTSDSGRVLCNGLIRDWVTWQLQGAEAFEQLQQMLGTLSVDAAEALNPGPPMRVSLEDARDIPTLQMPYGTIPITHASAGARRILALAYLLVWAWQEHLRASELIREEPTERIILLVDEMEAHLHPKWQRHILPALLSVVRKLKNSAKVQVVAATHAPLLLASIEPEFDPEQDALFMFDLVDNEVKVSRADWRPRGDANAWLTSEVFDLKEPRSVEAERALTRAKVALRNPNLSIEEVRDIHNELYRLLKDTDPFWPRWLARAEAAGIEP